MFGKRKWISEAEAEALVRLAQERTESGQEVDFDAMLGEIRSRKRVVFDSASMASGAAALFLTALVAGGIAYTQLGGQSRASIQVAEVHTIAPMAPMPPVAPVIVELDEARAAEFEARMHAEAAMIEAKVAKFSAEAAKAEGASEPRAARIIVRRG